MPTFNARTFAVALSCVIAGWFSPSVVEAQVNSGAESQLERYLGGGAARRPRVTEQVFSIGPEYSYTNNIFLENDLDGPFFECRAEGGESLVQDPADCPPVTDGGGRADALDKSLDGEPNEAHIGALAAEGRFTKSSQRYRASAQGNVRAFFDSERDEVRVQPNFVGEGALFGFQDQLQINGSAFIGRTVQNDQTGQSLNQTANLIEQETVARVNIGPTARFSIGSNAAFQARYSREETFQLDTDNTISSDRFGFAGLLRDRSERLQISGEFTHLSQDRERAGGDSEFLERTTSGGRATLSVSDGFALIGEGGVDELQSTRTDTASLEGAFWAAGARWRYVDFEGEALWGERFGGEYLQANIQYSFRDWLQLSARAERSLQFQLGDATANQIDQYFGQLETLEGALPPGTTFTDYAQFADLGDTRDALDAAQGQDGGLAVIDRYDARAVWRIGRLRFSTFASYADFDFGETETQLVTGRASVSTSIGRSTILTATAIARLVDSASCTIPSETVGFCERSEIVPTPVFDEFGDPVLDGDGEQVFIGVEQPIGGVFVETESDLIGGRFRADRRVGRHWTTFAEVGYSQRGSNQEAFDALAQGAARTEFDEAYVTVGLRRRFVR